MEGMPEVEVAIVEAVRDFVDRSVRPVVRDLEHSNTYPDKLIETMKQMGIFGQAVPEPWGHARVSAPCYVLVTEELARGWMSLAGAMGGHSVVARLILDYGTQEQRDTYLTDGEARSAAVPVPHLPALVESVDGLMHQVLRVAGHGWRYLPEGVEPSDAVDSSPGGGTATESLAAVRAVGLTGADGVVEQAPVADGGFL